MRLRALVIVLALFLATIVAIGDARVVTSSDDGLHTKLVDLQRRHVDRLLDHPDVTAVDVNHKMVGGERTDQLSLVIWVKKKLPEEEVPHERRLPRDIEGFQTDVIEGEIAESLYRDDKIQIINCTCPTSLPTDSPTDSPTDLPTYSPTDPPTGLVPVTLPEGFNITEPIFPPRCPCRNPLIGLRGGHCLKIKDANFYGTLGYFTRATDGVGILSNFHVTFAPPNRLTSSPVPVFPNDFVATVSRVAFNKFVDASHSPLCRTPPPPFMLVDGTVVPGIQGARCFDRVRFCGCTSGCTGVGRIHSTNWCGFVRYSFGTFRFCNQILFTPVPRPGDSGSLLINADTDRATGLVFARIGRWYGLANPIRTVLTSLGVSLAV